MTQEQQAFEEWLRLRWFGRHHPFLRPCNDVDAQQTYQDPDVEWAYVAWQARGEQLKAKLLSDEMVELAGRGYMKSGKDMGCYSEEAMKAALEAVVGKL